MDVHHIEDSINMKKQNISVPLFYLQSEYVNTFITRDNKYPFFRDGSIKVSISVFLNI